MIIIAHRGARSTHPENTLTAIKAAMDLGAKAIEIDIHEQDGEFWVIHDKWLDRTTDHQGLLSQLTKDELAKVQVEATEPLPTLAQVLAVIEGKAALNIEVKGIVHFDALYQILQQAIDKYHFRLEQLIISSFNHHWLQRIKQEQPHYFIGALTGSKGIDKATFAHHLQAKSINIDLDVIDEDYVRHAQSLGLKVFVYTVNHEQDWHWLDQLGVDGVFCDCPAKAIQLYPQPESVDW